MFCSIFENSILKRMMIDMVSVVITGNDAQVVRISSIDHRLKDFHLILRREREEKNCNQSGEGGRIYFLDCGRGPYMTLLSPVTT